MRILLCLNYDLMSNWALNLLAPALAGHVYDIVLSERVGKAGAPKAPDIEAWQNIESGILETIERAAGHPFQSFTQCAGRTESGTIQRFPSINEGEGLAHLHQFKPDLILSIRFGQIFKSAAIGIPRLGILNLHSGILPDYRGVMATFWALLHGETQIGCTLHYVTDGTIDTGALVGINRIPVDPSCSLAWHIMALYEGGVAMIAHALSVLEKGETVQTEPQKKEEGGYFSFPQQSEVSRFLCFGKTLYENKDYLRLLSHYGIHYAPASLKEKS